MKNMRIIATLFFLLFVAPLSSQAQAKDSTYSYGYFSARSQDTSLIAIVDSTITKTLPFDSLRLPPGSHHIIVMQERKWNGILMDTTITLTAESSTVITVPEKYEYTILASPPEAAVTIGKTKTGETPFQFTASQVMSVPVTISAMGYEPLTLEAPLQSMNIVHLRGRGEHAPNIILPNTYIRDDGTAVYTSLAVAVVAGTISVLAKRRADAFSDTYSATGDPSARASTNKYDVVAGVSLFVTEVSFGALTYYLLLQ
jgi:hypothetical protein